MNAAEKSVQLLRVLVLQPKVYTVIKWQADKSSVMCSHFKYLNPYSLS